MSSTLNRTPATEDPDAPEVAQTGRQVSWNYLVFALSRSTTLIMTAVLARILTPTDFGVFTLVLLVLNVFDYARDLGITLALVQTDRPWRRLAPTGLTLSAIFGVLASAGAFFLSQFIAGGLRHPELVPLVQVLAVGLLVSALGAVPASLLRRRIDFRGRLGPEVSGALIKTVLSIALALAGFGVWSLIWGQLAASVLTALMYWGVARTGVRPGFDRRIAGELIRFGLPTTLVGLVAFGIYNCDYVAIGHRLGDEQLGFYMLAYRLPELIVLMLCNTFSEVLFSSLSRWQHDRAALADHYLRTVRVVLALTAPLGLGMAALAPEAVAVLYGHNYLASANELAVLAVFTVIYSVTFHSGDVYKAMGRPGLLTLINLGKFVVLVPAVWFAAHLNILAVAVAVLVVEVMHCAVRLMMIRWVIDISFSRQLRTFSGPFAAGAGMALCVWSAAHLMDSAPLAVRVPALVMLGGALYVVFVRICASDVFYQGAAALRALKSRSDKAVIGDEFMDV